MTALVPCAFCNATDPMIAISRVHPAIGICALCARAALEAIAHAARMIEKPPGAAL